MCRRIVTLILMLAVLAPFAHGAKTLREVTRVKGQGASVIQGLGLVVGLNGTGDKGTELAMARPLAAALTKLGNPVSIDDIASSKSAALVLVTCEIPREGAKVDDRLKVTISVLNSAKSLEGGTLLLAPMTPFPNAPVYAFASGNLSLADADFPTVATIAKGGQMVRDVNTMLSISTSFDLIIDANFAGWDANGVIASEINQQYLLSGTKLGESLAKPIDPRTIRITVPKAERSNPASFFGDIMQTDISSAIRKLPAKVICDTRLGIIVITGDVQVSSAIITHKDLRITTILPPPLPGEVISGIQENDFAKIETPRSTTGDSAQLDDLVAAFDQLDIPPVEQIHILEMLHKAGKLHARLIIDGQE
ncbi:MAG: flagellar basal body P-ring protein FlgI [Phycisphaerales bacterium]|nr:flagellar basal body P-ring protein FlgI [Phycisphaerales bacterium]